VSIDDDPEEMVQQQFARLRFFERSLGSADLRTLDWGCGSGFNCQWLKQQGGAAEVVGLDVSEDAVRLARAAYPDIDFLVADACDPQLSVRPGRWDRILSCEVLEHVPDMPAFLANIRRHLAPDGAAFVTTPNRLEFSLGHEPSPVNKEHIKELTLEELRALVRPHFSRVKICGQRFRDGARLQAWQEDVRRQILACREGTRWVEKKSLRARLRQWKIIDSVYKVPALRAAWQVVRWDVWQRLCRLLKPEVLAYRWTDFEFVAADAPGVLWFCAALRP
jgi:SAM-dependent methyltransferase